MYERVIYEFRDFSVRVVVRGVVVKRALSILFVYRSKKCEFVVLVGYRFAGVGTLGIRFESIFPRLSTGRNVTGLAGLICVSSSILCRSEVARKLARTLIARRNGVSV